MMWLVWLALGALIGMMGAALLTVSSQSDLLAEVYRLRALEDGLHRLELRVIDSPGIGDVFRARLIDVVTMWGWAADDGRMVIAEGLSISPVVVVDEIGDLTK